MPELRLSPNQTTLADAVFAAGKSAVFVTTGARPLALPYYYRHAAAVLYTSYNGQAGGQAITDVLYGKVNPSGRLPITVPYSVGLLRRSITTRILRIDISTLTYRIEMMMETRSRTRYGGEPTYNPLYQFSHGLSYTIFFIFSSNGG